MNNVIKTIIEENKNIKKSKPGFPNIGKRQDNQEFGSVVKKIEEAWNFYDIDLYKFNVDKRIIKLGSGNPLDFKAFPFSIRYLRKKIKDKMFQYPPAAGDEAARGEIIKYLKNKVILKIWALIM